MLPSVVFRRTVLAGELQEPETMTLEEYASLVCRVQQEANVRKTIGAGEVERIMPYMTRALLRVRNDQSELSASDGQRLERYVEAVGACLKRCMLEDPAAVEMS
jgi:hypothetical protein